MTVPPLRDRREDIPLLVNHFLKKYATAAGRKISRVSTDVAGIAMRLRLAGQCAPAGEHIERAVALETGEELRVELPVEKSKARAAAAGVGMGGAISAGAVLPDGVDMEKYVADIERTLLQSALSQSNGVQTRAADLLKISYRSFRHLMKKYDL